ncbi:hypothetical protein U9M48_027953 [Paspalum notatum var. saurae]|uniref:Uncharacterized protein n=1 Tax=Paspalum notatum var. saurae TaxID=547442 RepID=A0AAQ3TVQ7_PASNO
MYAAQGMTFVQIPFSIAPQGSRVHASNPYQTPSSVSGQPREEQSGHNSDFVNNLFASGGSGQNSNEPGAM